MSYQVVEASVVRAEQQAIVEMHFALFVAKAIVMSVHWLRGQAMSISAANASNYANRSSIKSKSESHLRNSSTKFQALAISSPT